MISKLFIPFIFIIALSCISCVDAVFEPVPYPVAEMYGTITVCDPDPDIGCRDIPNTRYFIGEDGEQYYWDGHFGVWIGPRGYYDHGGFIRGYYPHYHEYYHRGYYYHGAPHHSAPRSGGHSGSGHRR